MIDLEKERYNIDDLREIIHLLRAENGCPWDREQTHDTLKKAMLEEAYEVVDAIRKKDTKGMTEELGDVLLQVVFHANLGEEAGTFSWSDICDGVCRKMIYRHPHVFGDVQATTAEEVLTHWEQLKTVEKGSKPLSAQMEDIALSLPSTERAFKIQKKAAKIGFDWDNVEGVFDKLNEEVDELKEAIRQGKNQEEEMGDVLFTVVNIARFLRIDPEEALTQSNDKFIERIKQMENKAAETGQTIGELSQPELEALWAISKHNE